MYDPYTLQMFKLEALMPLFKYSSQIWVWLSRFPCKCLIFPRRGCYLSSNSARTSSLRTKLFSWSSVHLAICLSSGTSLPVLGVGALLLSFQYVKIENERLGVYASVAAEITLSLESSAGKSGTSYEYRYYCMNYMLHKISASANSKLIWQGWVITQVQQHYSTLPVVFSNTTILNQ